MSTKDLRHFYKQSFLWRLSDPSDISLEKSRYNPQNFTNSKLNLQYGCSNPSKIDRNFSTKIAITNSKPRYQPDNKVVFSKKRVHAFEMALKT